MTSARPSVPPPVRWIARTLQEAGFDTWTVGGAVRDALMGRPGGDWDLSTAARPPDVQRLFKRTVPIGIDHGTVGVLARDGTLFEVTTFRKDVETDGRHAVVEFADRIEDDLARRDFTINAIAWHPQEEELLDLFNGVGDMEAGLLRTVGTPADRFAEDHLRILRAFRFAGLFDMTVEQPTWDALCGAVEHLRDLSGERVRDELLKVLGLDRAPSRALGLYADSGALAVLYPELEAQRSSTAADGWDARLRVLDALPIGRGHLRLAALLRGIDRESVAHLLGRLRLSNAQSDEAAGRAAAAPLPLAGDGEVAMRRWLSETGPGRLNALARIELARSRGGVDLGTAPAPGEVVAAWRLARRMRRSGAPLTLSELALDGRDLIRLGLKPGPHFGDVLDGLLDFVLEDPERNTAPALEKRMAELADSPDA
jgi:tRNA nucleotidyltransferase (CCA-adding enzyme)